MRIKRVAAIAATPFAIAGLGWIFQRAGLRRDARRYPPQGLLLSRGGRYLHVLRQGSGHPTVIFEAGLAASSLSWSRVQPLVSLFTSTASYDRAGLGWSSPSASRLTLMQLIDDLHQVVTWAGAGEPVVLVGHSFGSLLLLAFAQRYSALVAGLVLVDPVSLATWSDCTFEDQQRLQVGAELSRRGAWLAEFGIVRGALALLLHGGQTISRNIGRRAAGPGAATLERLTGEVSRLPKELWPAIAAHWSRAQSFRTMADTLEALPTCANEVRSPTLPTELPVVVLSAASATEKELHERDRWLIGLLEAEHKVLPETGHWLHLERPDEVAGAVQWCVERARLRA